MLRKKQRFLCYLIACMLLMAGMHTTYVKVDSIAKHAILVSRTGSTVVRSTERLLQSDDRTVQEPVYISNRAESRTCTMVAQAANRRGSIRRDLRMPLLFLWGLVVAYFLLRYFGEAEILCLHETKYWTALIKYIHDIDGKKRMLCLT